MQWIRKKSMSYTVQKRALEVLEDKDWHNVPSRKQLRALLYERMWERKDIYPFNPSKKGIIEDETDQSSSDDCETDEE